MEPKASLRKRSLVEIDDVIGEIIERNPEWFKEMEQIIQQNLETSDEPQIIDTDWR